jgi:2-dehydro-3-deoxyphosphogluconate aldolase/(4S)-4-hydroxy-2-oxoglutarate aldolase
LEKICMSRSDAFEPILAGISVIPVVVIEDAAAAVPLARALAAGGLRVIEITLRTGAALQAIEAIAGEVEDAIVGAGTVLSKGQLVAAARAGARFLVSPGMNSDLLKAAEDSPVPLMPGAATASEVMALMDAGYTLQKFFPAEPAGGLAYLKALAAPLPAIRFCPTGGIGRDNAEKYLALGNVACVGGSWVAPADAIAKGDWARIETLSREASRLGKAA